MRPVGSNVVMPAEMMTPITIHRQIDRSSSSAVAQPVCQRAAGGASSRIGNGLMARSHRAAASAIQPPTSPVTAAISNLNSAKGQPSSAAVTSTESTPVCGVLIKNPTVAPSLAPCFFKPKPVGITPHEQSGNGTPNTTARATPQRPVSCRRNHPGGNQTSSSPATAAPSSSHGASSMNVFQATCSTVCLDWSACFRAIVRLN